jgi:hypothetical protein
MTAREAPLHSELPFEASIARPSDRDYLEGFEPSLIRWVNDIRPSRIFAAPLANEAPSASDADRQRLCDEFDRDALSAIDRLIAHRTLGVSLWEGVDHVAVLARYLFEAISPPLLAEPSEPNISDLELISRALQVCRSLTWMVREWSIQNSRRDLVFLDNILTEAIGAVLERDEGFDEPKLRARPRSLASPRDVEQKRYFKRLASVVHSLLVKSLGYDANEAARKVAKHIDDHNLLPRKRDGKCVVPKSILNWCRTADGEKDDLLILHIQKKTFWSHFTKAGKFRAQGKRERAADALLSILTDASRISGLSDGLRSAVSNRFQLRPPFRFQ